MNESLLVLLHRTEHLAERQNEVETEEWLELVQMREVVLQNFRESGVALMDVDKNILRAIISYDSQLANYMQQIKDEAAISLERLNKSRAQKQSYERMYAGGSYFFDKRE